MIIKMSVVIIVKKRNNFTFWIVMLSCVCDGENT